MRKSPDAHTIGIIKAFGSHIIPAESGMLTKGGRLTKPFIGYLDEHDLVGEVFSLTLTLSDGFAKFEHTTGFVRITNKTTEEVSEDETGKDT